MSLKGIEQTAEADVKGFFARNKAHIIAYPLTALAGAILQHLIGKLL